MKVGDIVRLKCGSCLMVVHDFGHEWDYPNNRPVVAFVSWMAADGRLQQASLPLDALYVEPPS